MNDWFEWNGFRSTTHGVRVLEQPPITIPSERATFVDVPGKSGSLTLLEGDSVYDDMILSPTCYLERGRSIKEISNWLQGDGKVTFANRPRGFYYARIVNQIPFETILRGNPEKMFTVNFRCKPFWYYADVANITVTKSGEFITNPGTVPAEPVITVFGSGNITLMVNTTIIELEGIGEAITLDTQLMEAYLGMDSFNSHMSGEFPVLSPGPNPISWTGNVSKLLIQPNWRDL